MKLKLYNTCILPIFLYGSNCWAISKTDARKINVLDQWCLCMLLGIRWYQFVRNNDVRWLTKQPKLTAIIQSRRLTLFEHIMRMDDNADAKRILLASPLADWKRQLGRPHITWLSIVQQDLKQHHLMLPEAADLAQNHPLWRMMSTYGVTQSWVACQKRRRRRTMFGGVLCGTQCRQIFTCWIIGYNQQIQMTNTFTINAVNHVR